MGQLKVKVKHAPVTHKVFSKMQHFHEQLDNRTQSEPNITCDYVTK